MTEISPTQTRFSAIKLIWRPLPHTERLVVGTLERTGDSFRFAYDGVDLERAIAEDFRGYPGLPLGAGAFNGQAMAAFAARNPSPSRSDYERLVGTWLVPPGADPFVVIGMTGGRLPTDLFEFVPVIEPLPGTAFISNLAGVQFREDRDAFRSMAEGTELVLTPEPENPFDPCAMKVYSGGAFVARVKKIHAETVHRAIAAGLRVQCTLERATINGVIKEVLVRIQFHSSAD